MMLVLIWGKDSNNLLISKLALMVVCIFSYIHFLMFLCPVTPLYSDLTYRRIV